MPFSFVTGRCSPGVVVAQHPMGKEAEIFQFLRREGWVDVAGAASVTFLAAGEYNENYFVRADQGQFVFRINHGSQLGLADQIGYEFRVLSALASCGVTPRPFFCAPDANGLGNGVLLMEFLPGGPLVYERDWGKAAQIFARIHALPVARNHSLVVQADPVADIAAESIGLIERFPDHPMPKVGRLLRRYHGRVLELADQSRVEFADEDLCIVNTEVNSGNFLVDGERAWLVDWEKAVVSHRYQDLGHFLVQTTTRWKTDYRFDASARMNFLRAYVEASDADLDLETVDRRTAILERTILLRALSWCYMAYVEYTRSDRGLTNKDTFIRIREYLSEAPCFLR